MTVLQSWDCKDKGFTGFLIFAKVFLQSNVIKSSGEGFGPLTHSATPTMSVGANSNPQMGKDNLEQIFPYLAKIFLLSMLELDNSPLQTGIIIMNYQQKIYTVESVTAGHPDKVADRISDAILDAYLAGDPDSRVAVETFGGHGLLVIGGEVTSQTDVAVEKIAGQVYAEIGYNDELEIINRLVKQSPEIAKGVDAGGAGDQGIMYGYATITTESMMPLGVELAQKLTTRLTELRRLGTLTWLKPDGKAQVTLEDNQVRSVVISTQHNEAISNEEILAALTEHLLVPVIGDLSDIEVLVNPAGRFVLGGFTADTGLTGRKIMVDTYGGLVPHGGGAFSGKDPSKVDRSAAYMCRYVAKNLVAAGLAQEALVSVAYAIGRAEPLMLEAVDEHGHLIAREHLAAYDFRPRAIIERLGLKRPIYRATASSGHFGHSEFPWEAIH